MSQSAATSRVILDLACRQRGVVSRKQLLNAEVASRTIDNRISQGTLFPVYRGVYLAGRPLLTPDGALTASLLAAGEGAVLGMRSAGAVWGFLRRHRSPIEVIRKNGGANQRARIRVEGESWWPYLLIHETGSLPDADLMTCRGLKLTTPARTLRDLAATLSEKQFFHAFTEADRLGLLKDQDLAACVERTQGRRGGGIFRRAAGRRIPGIKEAASLLEAIVLGLCDRKLIPAPEANRELIGYRPDFRWPAHRLIVEADSYEFHRGREMFENDLLRAERLRNEGWDVRRFSWRMLEEQPDEVAKSIRMALTNGELEGK